jgi:hypothetical protein
LLAGGAPSVGEAGFLYAMLYLQIEWKYQSWIISSDESNVNKAMNKKVKRLNR